MRSDPRPPHRGTGHPHPARTARADGAPARAALALLAALALVAACDRNATPPPEEDGLAQAPAATNDALVEVRTIGEESNRGRMQVGGGTVIVLNLPADHSTGQRWQLVGRDPAPQLAALGAPTYALAETAPGEVGAHGLETFRFRAAHPGETRLQLEYRRANDPQPARTFEIAVEVTGW